jgi:glucuronide carrier protein
MTKYTLTDAKHAEILTEIRARRESGDAPKRADAPAKADAAVEPSNDDTDGTQTATSTKPLAAPTN